ncbi:MAG: response regulator, partial [Anaerolineales bacterium]|nr:response regulator [Anaerolineales bacterium]
MTDIRKLPQVLYIEDSEESRSLVRRLLAEKYVVLEASNPLDGLQLAEETQPNLILLDHNLPQMTGSEVATRLKKMLPYTPIVIISGDTSKGARERALAAGAVGFIAKPIDDDFEKLIDEYFHGKVEKLEHAERYLQAYQQELVERLEGNIRQLSSALEKNKHLLSQNEKMFSMLDRR